MKMVFMGSPGIAAQVFRGVASKYRPQLVITQTAKAAGRGQKMTPTAVAEWAKESNLAYLETENVNSEEMLAEIAKVAPDVIWVVAFGQILKEKLLNLPKIACLNVHASLLPKYRGAAPVQWAIWNGEKQTGITIQKMVKKLDAGDILLQKRTEIWPKETSMELLNRLGDLAITGFLESMQLFESGKYSFQAQDDLLATHARKIEKDDAVIDWEQSADQILCQIRALQPWPVAETWLEGTRLRIFKAEKISGVQPPGILKTDGQTYLQVGCGDGILSLLELQLESRKRLGVGPFLQGFNGDFKYQRLGR